MKNIIKNNWYFVIPVVWFLIGWFYARSLEAWAGLGMMIITLVTTVALIVTVITYKATERLYWSVFIGFLSLIIIYGGIILVTFI